MEFGIHSTATRSLYNDKLNKPWTGPWEVIKQLGEVVYRIKYVGKNNVGLKRRIVHYNQLKKFFEPRSQKAETVDSETTPEHSTTDDGDQQENAEDVVTVIDGPTAQQAEEQEAEPEELEAPGRPQRQRRPPVCKRFVSSNKYFVIFICVSLHIVQKFLSQ